MAHPAFNRVVVDVGQSRPDSLVIFLDRQAISVGQIPRQAVSEIINLCKPRVKIPHKIRNLVGSDIFQQDVNMIVHYAQAEYPNVVSYSKYTEDCEKHQRVFGIVEHHETVACPLEYVNRYTPWDDLTLFCGHSLDYDHKKA